MVSQTLNLLKQFSFTDVERIPELRSLILQLMETRDLRRRISDTLNVLPDEEVHKLFADYVEERFQAYLQSFFDQLYKGIVNILRRIIGTRLDQLEEKMSEMQASVLMSMLNPYAMVDAQITKETAVYLTTQPNGMSTLHDIYTQLATRTGVLIPGLTMTDKYEYVVRVLRKTKHFREHQGFLIELAKDPEMMEESESYANAPKHQS